MDLTSLQSFVGSYKESPDPIQQNTTRLVVERAVFDALITAVCAEGYRLAWLFGTDDRAENNTFGVHVILAPESRDEWIHVVTAVPENDATYPALTKTLMSTIWYERYLMDMFGVVAEGHPDPRRLVHHENIPAKTYPLRKDFAWNTSLPKATEPYPMAHVAGNGVYEIPVGPIHAGIIEPGHFRFNVAGERIINLEGKLFFTHKGVEKLVEGKSVDEALCFVERISDDSAASHALAYCQAVETASRIAVSEAAQLQRVLCAELERVTMHIHDIANIAGMGTGYTIMAAHGFRIKDSW
jgi:Ni,Fe-hydrogenase III component G